MAARRRTRATASCLVVSVIAFVALGSANDTAAPRPEPTAQDEARPHVVLLHGLGRSAHSMSWLGRRLMDAGFDVHNLDYPSREESVAEITEGVARQIDDCCNSNDAPIHFVTHSMGGIIVRALVARERPARLGRVVMLSPPNRGTEIVDELKANPLFRWGAGPAAQELGTGSDSTPVRLGPADFELGVITGDRSLNPIGSWLIQGDDDGTVAVESAKIEGMADFLLVDENHTFIMRSQSVAREIIFFLRNGRFSEVSGEPEPPGDSRPHAGAPPSASKRGPGTVDVSG